MRPFSSHNCIFFSSADLFMSSCRFNMFWIFFSVCQSILVAKIQQIIESVCSCSCIINIIKYIAYKYWLWFLVVHAVPMWLHSNDLAIVFVLFSMFQSNDLVLMPHFSFPIQILCALCLIFAPKIEVKKNRIQVQNAFSKENINFKCCYLLL